MVNNETGFRKSLGLFDSTALVIGSMIGSGIFIVSADMSRQLGSPGWLMVVWLITGLMTIFAALSYGELASMFPHAGGQYVYIREAYNPLSGFLYGWTLFMVIQTGTIAAVAMAFSKFFGVLVPWFSEKLILFQTTAFDINLGFKILHFGSFSVNIVQILAISTIVLLTYMNSQGIRFGKIVQNSFTFTKVAALAGFIIIGLFIASSSNVIEINRQIFWKAVSETDGSPLRGFALLAVLGTAAVGSLFSSDAWNNITFTGSEVKNSKKNLALSLFLGTFLVTILYLLANTVYLTVLPLRGTKEAVDVFHHGIQFAANDRLGTAAMSNVFGNSAAIIMAVFIVISTFGCNNGLILSGARVYYAMAQDKLFFRKAGALNKNNVPGSGLFIQAVWASILCLSGTYLQLLDYVVFSVLIFYVMTIFGIFILRIKKPELERPYKAFGYPLIPAVYIIIALFIMVDLLIYKPNFTCSGLGIVLMGIPVYFIWRKVAKKAVV